MREMKGACCMRSMYFAVLLMLSLSMRSLVGNVNALMMAGRRSVLIAKPSERRMPSSVAARSLDEEEINSFSASSSFSSSASRIEVRSSGGKRRGGLQSKSAEGISKRQRPRKSRMRDAGALQATSASTEASPMRKKNKKRSSSSSSSSSAWYQSNEMLSHEILSAAEELELGEAIVKAKRVRGAINIILQAKQKTAIPLTQQYPQSHHNTSTPLPRPHHITSSLLVKDGSLLNVDAIEIDLLALTDHDILHTLQIPGGRSQLRQLLLDGANARTTFMRCNIRLVVAIAKKWVKRAYDFSSSSGKTTNIPLLSTFYLGGWGRPSLDEVIQEGVVGLARAVDKFDPSRGFRFSTYSTHWITAHVRRTLQIHSTGSLRVPAQLHHIKSSYKALLKQYYDLGEPIPPFDQIASRLGISVPRLRSALRVTETLLSIDQPLQANAALSKGSSAGGAARPNVLISNSLSCDETKPEDHIDIALLRQSLENAMTAELSPSERHVLTLRLGLEDGQTKTVRQVLEVCGDQLRAADIRSIERRAFKKLRSPNSIHSHNLATYLHMIDPDIHSPFLR